MKGKKNLIRPDTHSRNEFFFNEKNKNKKTNGKACQIKSYNALLDLDSS